MSHSSLPAVMLMLLSMLCYQISASFAKQLIAALDPLTVVTLRLCFASIFIIVMFRSWRIVKRLPYLNWKDLLCYTAALCFMNILFYASLGKLPQGIAVGLEFIGPLTLALLCIRQRRDYLWVIMAILGVALMVPWQDAQGGHLSFWGVLFALSAGACWALYIYFGQKVVRQNIGLHALSIAIGLSALLLLPVSVAYHPEAIMQVQHWPKALLVALLATTIPYALDLMALKRLSKLSYGTLSSLSPALAALSGWFLLKEHISLWQALGLACVMLASVGVTLKTSTEHS